MAGALKRKKYIYLLIKTQRAKQKNADKRIEWGKVKDGRRESSNYIQ